MENLGVFLDRVVHSGEVEIVGKICKRGSSCFEDHHDFGESLARVETRHPPSLQSPTDLVVHCIIRELMPINGSKMHYLLSRNHRMYQASWRRDFKKDWKAARAMNLGNTVHTTDVDGWVCSCPGFVQSRFLLCKHLVKAKEIDTPVSASFFRDVKRRRRPPFWVISDSAVPHDAMNSPDQQEQFMHFEETDLESGSDAEDDDNATMSLYEAMDSKLSQMRDFLRTESEYPGDMCVKKLLDTMGVSMDNFLDDVKSRKNARTMNTTWTSRKHPASMYVNSC